MTTIGTRGRFMKVKTGIPRYAMGFFRRLGVARRRLLEMREKVEAAQRKIGTPNNIDAIQAALGVLDASYGRLELPYPISLLDLILIWGAPEHKYITSIVFRGLDIQFRLDDFAVPRARFLDLFGIDGPDEFWKTYHLRGKIEQFLGNRLNIDDIVSLDTDLTAVLFAQEPPPANALILNKHGHHELNYVPYANRGCDGITYGLLYDFHKRGFLTTVYHGGWDIAPYGNSLEPFVEKFPEPSTLHREHMRSYADYFDDLNDDVLIEYITSDINPEQHRLHDFKLFKKLYGDFSCFDKYDDDLDWLKEHTIALFISAYLEANPTKAQVIARHDRWRYDQYLYLTTQARPQLERPSAFLFTKTYPATPIPLSFFHCDNWRAIDNWTEFVDCLAALHEVTHPKYRFHSEWWAESAYRNMHRWFRERGPADVFEDSELRLFFEAKTTHRKKDGEKLFGLLDIEMRKVFTAAKDMASKGAEGYAFVAAIIFWNHCNDGEVSMMAADLLDLVSDNSLCPEFVKKTARLHAAVRHDKFIPRWRG